MSAVAAPALDFAVVGVEPEAYSAAPMLRFAVAVTDPSGLDVYTIALSAQIHIDADRRAYDAAAREALLDLFGEPERLPQTVGSLMLARVDVLVPSFCEAGTFTIPLALSADLEVATTRYVSSLGGGSIPLTFHFNGSVFYRGAEDRLQITLVPWECSARYRLPVSTWLEPIERLHRGSGFVRLQPETLARLRRHRAERGLPTFDAAIGDLLP
jgi:hypothetical protein